MFCGFDDTLSLVRLGVVSHIGMSFNANRLSSQ